MFTSVNDAGDKFSPVSLTPDMIPVPAFHKFYDSGDFFIIVNNKIYENLSLVITTPAIILFPVSTTRAKKLFDAYTLMDVFFK